MATNHHPQPLKTQSRPGGNEGEESIEGSHIATRSPASAPPSLSSPLLPPLPPTLMLIFSLKIQGKETHRSIQQSWS